MLRAVPDLPCVDDAEPFFCDFEIIMNEACTDQSRKFLMMDRCRYSCNFCKYCLLRILYAGVLAESGLDIRETIVIN